MAPAQNFFINLTEPATKCTINAGLNDSTELNRHRKCDGVHGAGSGLEPRIEMDSGSL